MATLNGLEIKLDERGYKPATGDLVLYHGSHPDFQGMVLRIAGIGYDGTTLAYDDDPHGYVLRRVRPTSYTRVDLRAWRDGWVQCATTYTDGTACGVTFWGAICPICEYGHDREDGMLF